MTFDDWFNANIAPTMPNDLPPKLRAAARESMVACWNAAIDTVESFIDDTAVESIVANGISFSELRAK